MKKLVSLLISFAVLLSVLLPGSISVYAKKVATSENCKKILIVGNSYTYFNNFGQILSKACEAAGDEALIVCAVKPGNNIEELLDETITFFAWYNGKRIKKDHAFIEEIRDRDYAHMNRAGSWDYVVFQYNSPQKDVYKNDKKLFSLFSNTLESSNRFIINSCYRRDSVKRDVLNKHIKFSSSSQCSIIDFRGIVARYNKVFENRVWFRDLTIRDSNNHPSVWGSYLMAFSVYAKIFGADKLADSPECENPLTLYNSDEGDISEFLDASRIYNDYTLNESINKAIASKLQFLVRSNAESYIGDVENNTVPPSDKSEKIVYYNKDGTKRTGWTRLCGFRFYLKNGVIARNRVVKIGKGYYLFNTFGERLSGWYKLNEKKYYLNKNGRASIGKVSIKNGEGKKETFWFSKKGVLLKKRIVKYKGRRYYVNKKGIVVKNRRIKINGKKYQADSKGRLKRIQ